MQITLTFQQELNNSLQVGDTIWYVSQLNINQTGGYDVGKKEKITKLGAVVEINDNLNQILISNSFTITPPQFMTSNLTDAFIMFSKDNGANLTSLKGYCADARFENNSKEKAELYAVSSQIVESSK